MRFKTTLRGIFADIQTVGVKVLTLDWEQFQPVENVVKAIQEASIDCSESFSR